MLPTATLSRCLPARKLAYQTIAPGLSRGPSTQQSCLSNLCVAMRKPTRHARSLPPRARSAKTALTRRRRYSHYSVASSQTTSKVKVLARDADMQLVCERGRPLMPRIITERRGSLLTPQFESRRVPAGCTRNLISG